MRRSIRWLASFLALLTLGASLASFSLGSLGAGVAGATDPPMTVDGFELRRRGHRAVAGTIQRAGRWQHQLLGLELGPRDERVLPADGGLRRDGHRLQHRPVGLLHQPGALSLPVHAHRRRRAGLRVQPDGQNGQPVTNLILDAPTLVGIFTGAINNWDDPSIAALNPDLRLPNEPITAFYRGDPSGENYLLGDYFLHTDPAPLTAFQQLASVPSTPGQPSATWAVFPNGTPPNLAGLIPVNGADADSQGPVHQPGGISFVETAYAKIRRIAGGLGHQRGRECLSSPPPTTWPSP